MRYAFVTIVEQIGSPAIIPVGEHDTAADVASRLGVLAVAAPVPPPNTMPTTGNPPAAPYTSAVDIPIGDFAALAEYTIPMEPDDVATWVEYSTEQQVDRWRALVQKQLRRAGKDDESDGWD